MDKGQDWYGWVASHLCNAQRSAGLVNLRQVFVIADNARVAIYWRAASTRAKAPQAGKEALESWDFKTMKRKRLPRT